MTSEELRREFENEIITLESVMSEYREAKGQLELAKAEAFQKIDAKTVSEKERLSALDNGVILASESLSNAEVQLRVSEHRLGFLKALAAGGSF